MDPLDPAIDPALDPLWSALWLAARLMLPLVGALAIAAAIGGLLRRLLGDDPALSAALRLLAVIAAIALFGAAAGDAVVEFARSSWGGP